MSSVGFYRQQANDEARAKGEPKPFGKDDNDPKRK